MCKPACVRQSHHIVPIARRVTLTTVAPAIVQISLDNSYVLRDQLLCAALEAPLLYAEAPAATPEPGVIGASGASEGGEVGGDGKEELGGGFMLDDEEEQGVFVPF